MSSTGMAQITLTCDENIRWRAPHSRISIWNVTCLLRGSFDFMIKFKLFALLFNTD